MGTSANLGMFLVFACARHAELLVHNAERSSCSETPTGLPSTWPLRHANSAGPRRRLSCQQKRDKSRSAGQQLRRRGREGSGTAAGATAGPTKHRYHHVNHVVSLGFPQHLVVCFHFTWVLRADPSTHSARPWPRPWRSMKPSQGSISTCKRTSSRCSAMKGARHSGLGGSSSKVVGLKVTFVCVKHV